VTAGGYKTSTGAYAPMIITQSGGKWTSATRIGLPADASASGQFATARGASCPSTGYCAFVGFYMAKAGRGFAAATK